MVWQGAYPDSNGGIGVEPGRGSTASTPRWMYVVGIIVILLVLLFALQHLIGGGLGHHA